MDAVLSKALREFMTGPLNQLVVNLAGESGSEWEKELKKFLRKEPCWVPKERLEVNEPKIVIPNLRSTGLTLADWLKAREELHKFFTGETIVLRYLFALTEEDLARTDIMPAFRPAGATNRVAVTWKQKLGVMVYEEMDVMKYTGSEGPKEPKLYLTNRSLRPDDDTLGKNAKTPDQLIQVPNKLWLDLFGYYEADNLYLVITGKHLDPETWTWFPSDRFGRHVAYGGWLPDGRDFCLYWDDADYSDPRLGVRSAREVPLRKR